MKSNYKTRGGSTHLYNPKKEGLGPYDIHYINAYKKNNPILKLNINKKEERLAA
tara:strand:- start:1961 stop:2122 length:162 start_codon:yes stop_codon:yes gene_type:complete